jgi:hypothetical protein
LMRFASIYKTHGEKNCSNIWWDLHQFTKHIEKKNCLKIWWDLHQFTKHMEKKIAWRFDESCINLQNTCRKYLLEDLMRFPFMYVFCKTQIWRNFFAWRFDDNFAAKHSWLFVGRAEFGMKPKKKKNLLKVLQAEDLFGVVEAAEPWQLKELLKQKIHFRSCEQKLVEAVA